MDVKAKFVSVADVDFVVALVPPEYLRKRRLQRRIVYELKRQVANVPMVLLSNEPGPPEWCVPDDLPRRGHDVLHEELLSEGGWVQRNVDCEGGDAG